MDRRQFLRTTAAGAAGLLVPGGLMAAAIPDIAVVKGQPGAATRAAVGLLGGMAAFVRPGQRVVIKPNMSFASPAEAGANTHPLVVQALAALAWEAGAASVLILDNTLAPSRLCLESSGIPEAAAAVRPGMVFAMDDAGLYREVALPGGRTLTRSAVAKEVLRADVLIAAPTAKSHSGAGVSLSLKGMMGLVSDRGVMHGRGLDDCVVDLCTLLKAHLTVIDATYVLSTGGPRGPGKVLNEQTVIASSDMVAADAYTVAAFPWYGQRFAPRQVGHIRLAAERGLGRMDVENLRLERLAL